ncbi:IclR family transcriptional regulator [Celeribacter halophilus]|uniref:IclR family transcriptional regulator n=2 Tax=Celeribacter halophilus TaxID=576117 RepID=UPI001C09C706|nr:IclR family transcriptional regulator [Celeribacter halophilus]
MQSSIVSKIMSLVTVISETRSPMSFSELVQKSGLNKSTLHRLLAICTEEGLVQFDKTNKVYLLGPKVFDLVRNAYSGYDIQTIALGEMTQLHDQFGANVTLGVPSGFEVVYLRVIEGKFALGSTQRPGMREPMHCSASGKVLMAFLPEEIVASKLQGYEFTKFTDRTITDLATFKTALAKVRVDGFAYNDREEYDHFHGISAPIFNHLGEPAAVLNIWSLVQTHATDELLSWAPSLMAAAARVTGLIGGKAP